MPLKPFLPLPRLSKIVLFLALFTSCSTWLAASPAVATHVGAGSLDDWLAIGLALLAALYCVQKRE